MRTGLGIGFFATNQRSIDALNGKLNEGKRRVGRQRGLRIRRAGTGGDFRRGNQLLQPFDHGLATAAQLDFLHFTRSVEDAGCETLFKS